MKPDGGIIIADLSPRKAEYFRHKNKWCAFLSWRNNALVYHANTHVIMGLKTKEDAISKCRVWVDKETI